MNLSIDSKSILYSIISDPCLKIDSEDSLFDFIKLIFQDDMSDEKDGLDIISFYEQIEFTLLSESKLCEFFDDFDINQITNGLWSKFLPCILHQTHPKKDRYIENKTIFKYDEKLNNRFKGIVHYLNEKCGGNSAIKGEIAVTGSSQNSVCPHPASNVADLDNLNNHYSTSDLSNQWVKFDFKNKMVRPNYYSIRT